MTRIADFSLAVLLSIGCPVSAALADDAKPVKQEIKEDFKGAGHAIGEGARKFGQGVKKAAVSTGHVFRDGAKEVKGAVTGEETSRAARKPADPPPRPPHKGP